MQNLLRQSASGSSRETLRRLAEEMLSKTQFNELKSKFEVDNFKPSDVIFRLTEDWISLKGKEATLEKFQQILRDNDLNDDAGN